MIKDPLRDVGLPRLTLTQAYLRMAADKLLHDHVTRQRDYHVVKPGVSQPHTTTSTGCPQSCSRSPSSQLRFISS